jgi:FlaA1/EpsC-like NDP-sugar epimerase
MQAPNVVEVIDVFLEKGITILTTSNFSEYNAETSSVDVRSIQKIEIQDLLERKEISIDKSEISKDLFEKVVLITGSAGSIGSEIARQVCSFNPKLLIVLDQSETALFEIKNEIKQLFPKVNFLPFLGDVRNKERMEYVISEYKPDVIYHAAAYKHVPMLEDNPVEAIQTNVLGTKNMADLAVKYKVKKFVMISTDKAVNPANIMGASKRIAEIYVQSYFRKISQKENNSTNFITTRFGNVLGSNGSVIPIFKRQIEEGGPVKVTHPEIIRYFMTIPEACNLVLEAGTLGKGGEIFIFDMGTPVKIDDLAKKMIRLAGFTPNVDIMIEYTGLRPGEKLYEELLNMKEITKETSHKKIMIATVQEYDYDVVSKQIDELIDLSFSFKDFLIVQKMKQIVPEFKSKNSLYESLDK